MESSLSCDPSDTTNALLTQLVQIGLGNLAAAGAEPTAPASAWSPPTSTLRIQAIAYASLCMSLLAAFGAVLGKQWLGYYKADAVVQSFPILLQLSLLFGIALSANMWYEQHTIAWVIITTTVFGILFYSLTLMAALLSPACPFQTPVSTLLRMLHVDRALRPMVKLALRHFQLVKLALRYFQRLTTSVNSRLLLLCVKFRRTSWREVPAVAVRAVCSFAWCCLQLLFGTLHIFVLWLHSSVVHSPAQVEDSEAQLPDRIMVILANNQYHAGLHLPDIPTRRIETSSVKWLLETSTDPEVYFAAASMVPQVEWLLEFDVSDTLHQLYAIYESCVDRESRIVPWLEEKASACTMALSHLYCERALQAYTGHGLRRNEISRSWWTLADFELFYQMSERCKAQDNVLALTARLSQKDYWHRDLPLMEFPDSALEWLSHILPYHFVAGRVDEDVEKLAITAMSRLLSPSSPPSTRIIANCTLLACVMIGVQFDKKDIVRIDKSSSLHRLAQSLWEQFKTNLWGDLDGYSIRVQRRVWNLTDVIGHMLQLGLSQPPSSQVIWNMDLCRKIYSRARSSKQNDTDPLAALRRVQCFRFDIVPIERISNNDDVTDPTWLWRHHVPLRVNSQSQEDFDWLVDYLDFVHSNDHDTACDILVLMSSMSVSCSPAKQHLFIERLIACMDSSMPYRLRHLALRAAHSSREVLTLIDAVDDADTVLTKFSSAIMSAVCPRPGATPADDGPDRLFNNARDLCYLKLVFALARNSIWHPHLVSDHHIDRCIGMIAEYCQSLYVEHSCYIVGILLRIAPEQVSATSRVTPEQVPVLLLESITEQQWWGMIRRAWMEIYGLAEDAEELLPILVEGTNKYMQIASKSDLEQLVEDVDRVVREVERRGLERIDDVKGLGTVARDMLLQRFGVCISRVRILRKGDERMRADARTSMSIDTIRHQG